MEKGPLIEITNYRDHDVCQGCGGVTPDGEPLVVNPNIKHFRLNVGNSGYSMTYCNECAAKIAQFLLDAWK